MNTQNILNFYGYYLDIKLDSSEFYDFELDDKGENYDRSLLDISTPIIYEKFVFDSTCLTGGTINDYKPWVVEINEPYQQNGCDFLVRRRTEDGWTLDFTFNRNNLDFSNGKTFYYWGIENQYDERIFADNNLSFSFTENGEIMWESYRYSGFCETESGYTETFYVSSGVTPSLCENGVMDDFNITIVFQRNHSLENCEIENDGGWNDLIIETEILTSLNDWLTGSTLTVNEIEDLNKKWNKERTYRLGTLRIYLNGNQIYKINNWEEIVPSKRGSDSRIVQMFGGGSDGFLDIHTGDTLFNILNVKYYEEPLSPLNVKHHYLSEIKPNNNITECSSECVDDVYSYVI